MNDSRAQSQGQPSRLTRREFFQSSVQRPSLLLGLGLAPPRRQTTQKHSLSTSARTRLPTYPRVAPIQAPPSASTCFRMDPSDGGLTLSRS